MLEKSYVPQEISTPAQKIQNVRFSKGRSFEKLQIISGIVISEFQKRATFIKSSSFRFLFDQETKHVYSVGDNRDFKAYMNETFGINREFDYVLNDLDREVQFRGIESEVHRFAYWDKSNHKLHIDRRNGEVIVLDGSKIDIVSNGMDGVFFLSPKKADPIEWEILDPEFHYCEQGLELNSEDLPQKSLLLEVLTKGLRFVGPLSPQEQKSLLLIIVYVIFFESINPTKPVIVATGPKGSGKTDLCRNIGRILIGKSFEVTRFRNDERDFASTCAHNYLVVLDNLEEKSKWLMDMVAIIATGGEISMRELHTTCSELKLKLRVFLFLNAIDPKLRRDDIADRLMIFQLDRLDTFRSESEISSDIEANQSKIWGELLTNLNSIVQRLKENALFPPGKFRLADFEVFAKRICADPNALEAVLEKMEGLRGDYSLENDNLSHLLELWLQSGMETGAGRIPNIGRQVTASELLTEFQSLAKVDSNLECYYGEARSLGKKIHQIQPELERLFGLEVFPPKGGGPAVYRFTKKREI